MNESINQTEQNLFTNNKSGKARWPGADSGAKGRRSILMSGPCCVLEQDKFTSKKHWLYPENTLREHLRIHEIFIVDQNKGNYFA